MSDTSSGEHITFTPKRMRILRKIILFVAVTTIFICAVSMLFTFLTHGNSSNETALRMTWLRGLVCDGGVYSDTVCQGSKQAIFDAVDSGSYIVKLDVEYTQGSLKTAYENGCTLEDALSITAGGACGVIIQINSGGEQAAQALCTLLTDVDYVGNLAVLSADLDALHWLYVNFPNVIRGILITREATQNLSGFEAFCCRNMLKNYTCRPYFAVFEAKDMPTMASRYIRAQIPVFAGNVSDISLISKIGTEADGFIIGGFSFENE